LVLVGYLIWFLLYLLRISNLSICGSTIEDFDGADPIGFEANPLDSVIGLFS